MSRFVPELVVISGCMFAGKTEELIRQIRLELYAKHIIQVFKPKVDHRYAKLKVVSHNGRKYEAIPARCANDLYISIFPETQVVGIDEVQFFDSEIVEVCDKLVDDGKRVIVAGLPLNFRGEDFGPMPQLLARAESVTNLHAICVVCGDYAYRTQRLVNGQPARYDDPIILIGAEESYEARCRKHHEVPGKP